MVAEPVLDRSQRTELARAARREEILAAARRVFATRGFRGTTIADIAEEAKIALGTIYLYFPSKEAVFAALNQLLGELITTAVTNIPVRGTLESSTRARVGQVFEACARNRDLVRLVVLNTDPGSEANKQVRRGDDERMRPLERGIAAGMRAGVIRDGDARVVARLIHGLVSIAVYKAFVLSDGRDAEKYREVCADMIVAYLTPPLAAPPR